MRRMGGDGGVGRARSRMRRDGNLGTGTIFYPRMTLVPDVNRDGYGMNIFFHPRITQQVPDTLLPL
jgi:hypothetical protein